MTQTRQGLGVRHIHGGVWFHRCSARKGEEGGHGILHAPDELAQGLEVLAELEVGPSPPSARPAGVGHGPLPCQAWLMEREGEERQIV